MALFAGIAVALFFAMQTLRRGFRTHLWAQNNPLAPLLHAPAPRRKSVLFAPEEDGEEDE